MSHVKSLAQPKLSRDEIARAKAARAIVLELPDDGCVLIVHAKPMIPVMRGLIEKLRGPGVAASTRIFVAATEIDELPIVGKLSATPVFREPFVLKQREHYRMLAGAWRL